MQRAAEEFCREPSAEECGEGLSSSTELVDCLCDRGIFLNGWGVVWLEPRIDHQRPVAAPVFLVDRLVDAVHIGSRV